MADAKKLAKRSPAKGAAFERLIANMLTEATGTTWKRRVRNHAADSDIVCENVAFAGLSIECKHANTLALPRWWRQTQTQAQVNSRCPVLIYRKTASAICVQLDAYYINRSIWPERGRNTVTMDWETAMQWLREQA